MVFPIWSKVIVVDGHRINDMLNAIPLRNATRDDIRASLTQNGENCGKLTMFVQLNRGNLRCMGVPRCIAMQFRTGTIEHRCPVNARIGRQNGAFLCRIAPLLHEHADVGNVVCLGQAIAAPAINSDDEDMLCLRLGLLRLCLERGYKRQAE